MGIAFGCFACRGFNPTCYKCGGEAYRRREETMDKLKKKRDDK